MNSVAQADRFVYYIGMRKVQQLKQTSETSARERILHTAHDLFYREGVRATGVDRIIEQAGVSKVTFYRHFPSKNDLIAAFLEFRHENWMTWFTGALQLAPKNSEFPLKPVLAALKEWFSEPDYRGCAFINGVVELDGIGSWVTDISLRHKRDMKNAIAELLPQGKKNVAQAAAMAIDGAIIRMQMEKNPRFALKFLELILRALCEERQSSS